MKSDLFSKSLKKMVNRRADAACRTIEDKNRKETK